MKHTKGKVKVSISSQFGIRIITKDGLGIAEIFEGDGSTEEINEAEANAELIAEAFNVAEECGLTPRQLLAQRDELLEALKELYISCNPMNVIKNKVHPHGGITKYYVGGCGIPSDEAIHKAFKLINNTKK